VSTPAPAPGVVRRLTAADAEAVLDVAIACDVAEIGEGDTDLSDVRAGFELPGAEWFGVDDETGGLAAFAWAGLPPSHAQVELDVRVRPGRDAALGELLLPVAREAAARIDPTRHAHLFVHVDDTVRQGWLAAAGGEPVRHFWRMVIEFDDTPPAPPPAPDDDVAVEVVGADEQRKRQVFEVIETSFQDHFGREEGGTSTYDEFVRRTHSVSGFDPALWWVAIVDGRPAAALVGRAIPEYGYVNSLGTLREFRGRGLARLLLLTSFVALHQRGYRRVVLGVDASNPTGAVRLYESVGMRAEHTWAVWDLPPVSAPQ
jgi:ribosomal protein S18 acetylase RimI-like enzyme